MDSFLEMRHDILMVVPEVNDAYTGGAYYIPVLAMVNAGADHAVP